MAETAQVLNISFGVNTAGLSQGMATARNTLVTAIGVMLPQIQRVTGAIDRWGDTATDAFVGQERALAELGTIFTGTAAELEQIDRVAENLSDTMGVQGGKAAVLGAAYQAVSAGALDMNEALEVTEASLRLSIAGLSDTESATRAVSSVLNVYGRENIDAAEASDKLFTAVRLGVTRLSEVSDSLGNAISTAGQLGVSIDELLAGFVALTKSGLGPQEAMTALNRAMFELTKGSDDIDGVFRSLGFENGRAAIATLGFQGALTALNDELAKSGQDVFDASDSIRALKALLPLTTSGADDFADALVAMDNASAGAGASMDAFTIQNETTGAQLQIARNRAENASAAFGDALAPATIAVADAQAKLAEILSGVDDHLIAIVGTAGIMASKILSVATSIGFIGLGLKNASDALKGWKTNSEEAADSTKKSGSKWQTFGSIIKNVRDILVGIGAAVGIIAGAIAAGVTAMGALIAILILAAVALLAFQIYLFAVTGAFEAAWDIATDIIALFWDIIVSIGKIGIAILDVIAAMLGLSDEWETLKGLVKTAIEVIVGTVLFLKDKILEYVGVILDLLDWEKFLEEAKKVVEGWEQDIKDAIQAVRDWIDDKVAAILGFLGKIKDFFKDKSLVDMIIEWISAALDAAVTIIDSVRGFAAWLGRALWAWIRRKLLDNPLGDLIIDWLDAFVSTVGNIVTAVADIGIAIATGIWDALIGFFNDIGIEDILDAMGFGFLTKFLGVGGLNQTSSIGGPGLGAGGSTTTIGGASINVTINAGNLGSAQDRDALIADISDAIRTETNLIGVPRRAFT